MRRTLYFVMALALVLGFTQCKKEQPTPQTQGVRITLNVNGGNNNSRVIVNPTGHTNPDYATVTFEEGDVIYVGYNNAYVGTLTYSNGTFDGPVNISETVEGEHLHFYFLGGVGFEPTVDGNTATVVISDQTTKYPVISYSPSNEPFTTTNTSYSAKLQNKVSILKFNVTTLSTAAICITGMNNKVTVNFGNPTDEGFEYGKDGEGVIKMKGGSGSPAEKWAIVLPQEAVAAGGDGTAFSVDGAFTGTRGAVPLITENGYLTEGIAVNITNHGYVDLGLPSGTLWATCNVGADAPEKYGYYFAWGETQPKDTYNWDTYQYRIGGDDGELTKYCNNSNYGYNGFTDDLTTLLPEDDAATANWGSDWRMPTKEEWEELYNNTTHTWTTQNGVSGRLFTASNGNSLFLPAAGQRFDSGLYDAGDDGYYRSSSLYTDSPDHAWTFYFNSNSTYVDYGDRHIGRSVRAVRSPRQN